MNSELYSNNRDVSKKDQWKGSESSGFDGKMGQGRDIFN